MEDLKNTVIVTGLASDIEENDLIKFFESVGKVKRCEIAAKRSEGKVIFADSETAEQAVKTLKGKCLKGKIINVQLTSGYSCDQSKIGQCSDRGRNTVEVDKSNGLAGEDNERDSDSKSGKPVAKTDIQNLGKRPYEQNGGGDNDLKEKHGRTDVKSGKGEIGKPNVSLGHICKDGKPGPSCKVGSCGKPLVNNEEHGRVGGGKEKKDRVEGQSVQSAHACEDGKSCPGGNGGESGNAGEDGEPGSGGKGGAGGKPAVNNKEHGRVGGGKEKNDRVDGQSVQSANACEDGKSCPGGIGGADGKQSINNEEQNRGDVRKGEKGGVGEQGVQDSEPGSGDKSGAVGNSVVNTGEERYPGGDGGGGKDGVRGHGVPSGHAGEDCESGPGGKGGVGGQPAVNNEKQSRGGGGKGGKGGAGGHGVPSGNAGEDGEPGPGGKGGAGGKPAVNNAEQSRGGGGKGGKGGVGGFGVPSGNAGEDGEPSPGGKGGAGGKPAVKKSFLDLFRSKKQNYQK